MSLNGFAQVSPPLVPPATAPWLQVGKEKDSQSGIQFDSNAAHFLYCPDGEQVRVEVYAQFTPGTACDGCPHDARSVQWVVEGTENFDIVSEDTQLDVNQRAFATLDLGDAGDTVTVTCIVGTAGYDPGEECPEGRNGDPDEHGGNHNGAQATCTFKLWRLDLDVSGGDAEPDLYPGMYKTTFGQSITTSAVPVGATPTAPTQNLSPWNWQSTDLHEFELLNSMTGNDSWSGKFVAPSVIEVGVVVLNECSPPHLEYVVESVIITPSKRRSGWDNMTVTHAGEEESWKSDKPNGFPILDEEDFTAWGQNTNTYVRYEDYSTLIVTPVYSGDSVPASKYADATGIREEIVSGPNSSLWYLSDSSLFESARKSRINHWITPNATKSSTAPALGPAAIGYSNWCNIYSVLGTYTCTCTAPSGHYGVGGNIRYMANIWHEGYGCPYSPNQELLGHQIRIEEAVPEGDKYLYDAVWLSDLLWSKTEVGILAAAEYARSIASTNLATATRQLEYYVTDDPTKHNFHGKMHYYNGSGWVLQSTTY